MSAVAAAPAAGLRGLARAALRPEARALFVHDWRRTLLGEPALPAGPIRAVAVVCTGNLCRSPFAAALLALARPELAVVSFGLEAAEGHPADPRAIAFAAEWGCDLAAHRTRPLGDPDVQAADLLLAMDALQGRALARRWPAAAPRVRLLGDFLAARPFAIVDPWSYGEPVWRSSYARIERAVARLAQKLGEPR